MFGLGFGEMLLILAVALVVIGPKKLPGLARTLGRGVAEFRRHADEIQRTLQRELHAPLAGDERLRTTAKAPGQVNPGPPPGSAPAYPPPADSPSDGGPGPVDPPPQA